MRLATLRLGNRTRAAIVDGDSTQLLPFASVGGVLAAGVPLAELRPDGVPGPSAPDVEFAPVVPRPHRIVCVGHNYTQHLNELGHGLPDHPTLFAKFYSALIGPHDRIILDAAAERWDWEAELVVVVGRAVRRAGASAARAAIAGYTVANDISARDWQRHTSQWLAGKAWDGTMPLGPVLVTADEIDAAGLVLTCSVDGVEKQRASTADLLFGPEELVAYASRITTLEPGDLILTGTPGGVGAARTPPEFLQPGQVLETHIKEIGTCRNVCQAG